MAHEHAADPGSGSGMWLIESAGGSIPSDRRGLEAHATNVPQQGRNIVKPDWIGRTDHSSTLNLALMLSILTALDDI